MSSPAGRATLATAGAAAALLAAWLLPPLAILVVWPLLLVVPGWFAVGALGARIDTAGRLGLAVVLTVAISTHLVNLVSLLAGGYGRGAVFAAAGVAAVAIPVAAWLGRWPTIGHPARSRALRWALAAAVPAMVVVGVALGVGLWRVTPDGVSSGGTNWSDLGVHLAIAETLNAGAPFPPDVPFFAGVPLVYHWFADFHAAMLAQAAGIFSVPAMVTQSTVLAGALALLVFSLARRLLRGDRARRAGFLAALLVVLGGGTGYVLLVRDLLTGAGSLVDLVARHSYDNQWLTEWPYFRIPSVMGTGLLAHRATTAGLPMLVGAILLLVAGLPTLRQRLAGWRDRPALIAAAGLLGALLAPFHFFFFPVVPLLALAWVLTGDRLRDDATPRNAAAFALPYLLAVPFALPVLLHAGAGGSLRLVGIWQSAPVADGPAAVAFFYLTNLGVPFVLALMALLAARPPHRSFLASWVVALFLVPNVVQVSAIDFDMNKYFQSMWIAVAVLAAWLLHRWPWPAIAVCVALSVPSPLLVAAWTATSDYQVLTAGQLRAADWVRHNTPADAVFVTDGWVNSLTDSAGRRRLTSFAPYVANLGYDPDARIADVAEIYCGGDAERSAALMQAHGATYLVDDRRPTPCEEPVDFGASGEFELAYAGGPRIWRLAGEPAIEP